jgi:hypothetical protein
VEKNGDVVTSSCKYWLAYFMTADKFNLAWV